MASHEIPNRGPELIGVNYAFMITALIAFSLRVYVRVGMVKAFGTDDKLMGLALVRPPSPHNQLESLTD